MKHSKEITIELPPEEDGMIGRECPRCRGRFTVDMGQFETGGYLNLRCPYCEFIAEIDKFLTGEQRQYVYTTQKDELLDLTEDVMGDVFEEVFSSSDLEVEGGEFDLGNVQIESPEFQDDTGLVTCEECGFVFGLTREQGVCPVCR